jgi:hypothetical protein
VKPGERQSRPAFSVHSEFCVAPTAALGLVPGGGEEGCELAERHSMASDGKCTANRHRELILAILVDQLALGLARGRPHGEATSRHHQHRQVYFHRSVRAAQLLLKSIFERMQDLGSNRDTRALAPRCFHRLIRGERPTLGDFLNASDAEATSHREPVLRYLSNLFLRRRIPKCILDSSRLTEPISKVCRIANDPSERVGPLQQEMWPLILEDAADVLDKMRDFVGTQLQQADVPKDAASYLVKFEVSDA